MNGFACPSCGQWNRVSGNYCSQCGCSTAPDSGFFALRSVGVAYALWALCIFGVAGVHRFYAGRYVTGALWLVTWGFLGVGLIIDLFLIPEMVEEKNRRLAWSNSFQRA